MKNILLVGRHSILVDRQANELKEKGFIVFATTSDVEAIEWAKENHPEIVFLMGAVEPSSRKLFNNKFSQMKNTKIVSEASPSVIEDTLNELKD